MNRNGRRDLSESQGPVLERLETRLLLSGDATLLAGDASLLAGEVVLVGAAGPTDPHTTVDWLSKPTALSDGKLKFIYDVTASSWPVTVQAEFSVDLGVTWHAATYGGAPAGEGAPDGSDGDGTTLPAHLERDYFVFIWDTRADLPDTNNYCVQFRMSATSANGTGPTTVSAAQTEAAWGFPVNNGASLPAAVSVTAPNFTGYNPLTGTGLTIYYILTDALSRSASMIFQYQILTTSSASLRELDWKPMTQGSGGHSTRDQASSPDGTDHLFTWDTAADFPTTAGTYWVYVRAIAVDAHGTGTPVTTAGVQVTTTGLTTVLDFSAAFMTTWTIPAVAYAGAIVSGNVNLVLTNTSTAAFPANTKVEFRILLVNFHSDLAGLLKVQANVAVGGLASGASRSFPMSLTVPMPDRPETYRIIAVVNVEFASGTPAAVTKTHNATYTAEATGFITVGDTRTYDLVCSQGSICTLPGMVVQDTPLAKGSLSVIVRNMGNSALPAGQKVNITLVARDTTGSGQPDVVLASLNNQSVGGLKSYASKTFTLTVNQPAGLPLGSYKVVAIVTPVGALVEVSLGNNSDDTAPDGSFRTIISRVAEYDLAAALGTTWTLPSVVVAGAPLAGNVSVTITNTGSLALPTTQKVNVQFIARDQAQPGQPDVALATLTNQAVGGLLPGASKTFTATVSLLVGLPAADYDILAVVTPVPALAETTTANNTANQTAQGVARTIVAGPAEADLAISLTQAWALPKYARWAASMAGSTTVSVQNLGNAALAAGTIVNITLVARDMTSAGREDVVLDSLNNQSVAGLLPGASRTFVIPTPTTLGLDYGTWQIVAVVTPVQPLAEISTANNTAALDSLGNPAYVIVW